MILFWRPWPYFQVHRALTYFYTQWNLAILSTVGLSKKYTSTDEAYQHPAVPVDELLRAMPNQLVCPTVGLSKLRPPARQAKVLSLLMVRVQLFKTNNIISYCFVRISIFNISNRPIFFVEKMWEAHFFQQKISGYLVIKL